MKITIEKNPEQLELIRAMGSKDPAVSREAMEAFAAFVTEPIGTVLQQAATIPMIYSTLTFNEDDSPTIPVDLFSDTGEGYITTYSQQIAGGLPTSQIEGGKEIKVSTFRLDSAISWLKKYARRNRLPVIAKALERFAQEIMLKKERNGWAVVLKALAEASTRSNKHYLTAANESVFHLNDLSRLKTRFKRILTSWAGGTPSAVDSRGITELFCSPEIMQQVRGFAFNPMNVKNVDGTAAAATNTGIPLTENMREQIYNGAGATDFFGISLIELNELGLNQRYNILFQEFMAGDSAIFGGTFDATTDELLVAFDSSREGFIEMVAENADSQGTLVVMPDDQFPARSDLQGLYGYIETGYICTDSRCVGGLIV